MILQSRRSLVSFLDTMAIGNLVLPDPGFSGVRGSPIGRVLDPTVPGTMHEVPISHQDAVDIAVDIVPEELNGSLACATRLWAEVGDEDVQSSGGRAKSQSGDAAGIQALLQMAEKREQISSPFNFLHTVHMDTSFRVTHHTLHDQAACGARFRV